VSTESLAHQRAITPADRADKLLLYPHPLTLARDRAEAERIRLADSAAYSAMCSTWGRLGGLTILYRYGREHFRLLALHRWGDAAALGELAARVDRRRS
jgi:hypothetical protein